MKLHRLELEGFGPFLERQVVDFDAFADDGIFLIAGRTGAGKSSVLDGVCYGLYGGVPRYDGAERRLRSDHCGLDDPTSVTVEFSAEGRRWRVTRSPEYERPKRSGTGTTKEPHRASLEVLEPEGWTGVAARPVDVAARLDEILGLTQQQFLQVILLAQNRFARFLLAKNDERQTLLRTLFGTRSYEQYAADLDERRKRALEDLAAEGNEVSTLLDEADRMIAAFDAAQGAESEAESTPDADPGDAAAEHPRAGTEPVRTIPERLASVVRAVERMEYRVEAAAHAREAAKGLLDAALVAEREATTVHERQVERRTAREALAALESETERISALRAEADAAAAAEALRASVDAADRARDGLVPARAAWTAAVSAAEHLGETGLDDAAALAARDDELTAVLAHVDEALAREDDLAAVEAEVLGRRADVERAETRARAVASRRAEAPAVRDSLDDRLGALADATTRRDVAVSERAEISRRIEAALDAERLAEERDKADLSALVRADELKLAVDAWSGLLRRRLAGAAGELAHALVEGEPCAVCGSREHPAPAVGTDDPVTDAEVSAAEDRKNAAAERDRLASDASRVARDAHTLAAARAGGEPVSALRERRDRIDEALAQAEADVIEHDRLARERTALLEREKADAEEGERLARELADARQLLALRLQSAESLRAELAEARGEFPTVRDRRRDLRARRDAVRAVSAARSELDTRVRAAADARAALDELLAESVFAEEDEVRAALRSRAERRRLESTIAEHDAELAATRRRLLDLELLLVGSPDDPIDLAPSVAAVRDARAAVEAAAAAHAAMSAAAVRVRDLAERADAGSAAVARLSDAHAVVARLADTVAGRAPNTRRMALETFVLAAELEEIVDAANLRLDHMSAGRYRLQHTDALAARGAASGLGLEVMDAFTGQCRPPQSLSGGETFLASLALALGLAEVVTARAGGIRLDTLFIDEGFGSLDDETLDLAMRTLDELRQGGRTVGVISHVGSMKDQLPAQVRVTATPRGPSIIRQDTAVGALA
ncbi:MULTISPECIES: AAA family ATPase [Microbacterium]|jgi:exonuclease SbcC|uniref:AAA family ATPase n=1 Tax=Microbacterium TaxID=33882 RepID=UPI001D17A1BC|nr:SMC family ATPase [Microbacterium testaceum]MCC4247371.1 SMC family ATPase [Microbacterium testaceum]